MITRRRVFLALGASALAPFASFAQQQGKVWRVGFLVQRHMDFVDADYINYGLYSAIIGAAPFRRNFAITNHDVAVASEYS